MAREDKIEISHVAIDVETQTFVEESDFEEEL